jgi:hypothetical protein
MPLVFMIKDCFSMAGGGIDLFLALVRGHTFGCSILQLKAILFYEAFIGRMKMP